MALGRKRLASRAFGTPKFALFVCFVRLGSQREASDGLIDNPREGRRKRRSELGHALAVLR
jgi:hypothetical protein